MTFSSTAPLQRDQGHMTRGKSIRIWFWRSSCFFFCSQETAGSAVFRCLIVSKSCWAFSSCSNLRKPSIEYGAQGNPAVHKAACRGEFNKHWIWSLLCLGNTKNDSVTTRRQDGLFVQRLTINFRDVGVPPWKHKWLLLESCLTGTYLCLAPSSTKKIATRYCFGVSWFFSRKRLADASHSL